jgi:hypothetical protein
MIWKFYTCEGDARYPKDALAGSLQDRLQVFMKARLDALRSLRTPAPGEHGSRTGAMGRAVIVRAPHILTHQDLNCSVSCI